VANGRVGGTTSTGTCNVLIGNIKGRDLVGNLGIDRKIILNWIVDKCCVTMCI
jgi:hypothetical protein